VAVHVTQADLYKRLWCVREIDEAAKLGLPIVGAMPVKEGGSYLDVRRVIVEPFLVKLIVNTKKARCTQPADELRIRRQIEGVEDPGCDGPAYRKLDQRITDLRLKMYVDAFLWYSGQAFGLSVRDKNDRLYLLRQVAVGAIRTAPETKEDALKMFRVIETEFFNVRARVRTSADVVQITAKAGAKYIDKKRNGKMRRVHQIHDIAEKTIASRNIPGVLCADNKMCGGRNMTARVSSPMAKSASEPAMPVMDVRIV